MHYDHVSSDDGSDMVRVSPTPGSAPRTYLIGVRADAGCTFTVLAATDGAPVTLELGVPLFVHVDAPPAVRPLRFYATRLNASLQISATGVSADPALYVSRTVAAPNASTADAQAGVTRARGAVVRLDAASLGDACAREVPCTYYAGLSAPAAHAGGRFTVLVAEEGRAVQLVPGQPQVGSTVAGEMRLFVFALSSRTLAPLNVELTSDGAPGALSLLAKVMPASELWRAATAGSDYYEYSTRDRQDSSLTIPPPASAEWCASPPCAALIAIDARAVGSYTLLATLGDAAPSCAGGVAKDAKCYRYFPEGKTWRGAESACQLWGGHLASVHSEGENSLVHDLCLLACWIGFSDLEAEGTWRWSDGTPSDYTNWQPGEPNGRSGDIADAAYMYPRTNTHVGAAKWDDDFYTKPMPYVCMRYEDGAGVSPATASILSRKLGSVSVTKIC